MNLKDRIAEQIDTYCDFSYFVSRERQPNEKLPTF